MKGLKNLSKVYHANINYSTVVKKSSLITKPNYETAENKYQNDVGQIHDSVGKAFNLIRSQIS